MFNVVYPDSHFSDDDEGIDFQTAITNNVEEFDCTLWKDGDVNSLPHPSFIATPGITVEIPDDARELFFLNLFLTPEIVECLLEETNRYASLYLILHKDNLKPTLDYNAWPKEGITKSKMMLFFAYYMGILKKDSLRSYWTIDSVSSTPFPSVMLRRDFLNILGFLHCSNPADYIPRDNLVITQRRSLVKFYH